MSLEDPASSIAWGLSTPGRTPSSGQLALPQATMSSNHKVKESQNAPKSKNSRSQWKPLVVKEGGTYDILIKIKHANGDTGLFCNSGPTAKVRDIWEAAVEFQVTKVESGELLDYVNVRNIVGLKHDFRADLMNLFIDSTAQFDRFCTKFVVEKKLDLLCLYFSVLTCSKDFTKYVEEENSEDGFRKDGEGLQEKDILAAGVLLSEFLEFSSLARIDCKQCGNMEGTPKSRKNKRITELFKTTCPPKKMTKLEHVESEFKKECESKDGLEQKLVSNYVGWRKIPLELLKVCENV